MSGAERRHSAPGQYNLSPPPGVPEDVAAVLAEPDVILYVGKSEDSLKAFHALEQANVSFQVIASDDDEILAADWGGRRFKHASGVQELAGVLREFGDVFLAEAPQMFPSKDRNPQLEQWMQVLRERQLAEARSVMEHQGFSMDQKRRRRTKLSVR